MGAVYVGPRDDFGWNQAHAVAPSLKPVPGITVVEEENVPETDAVSQSMESMINLDGEPDLRDLVRLLHSVRDRYGEEVSRRAVPPPASLWNTETHPKNAGSYFCYLNQAHYVNGVAAGLSTKSNKIGFVAAKPISSVLSQHQLRRSWG